MAKSGIWCSVFHSTVACVWTVAFGAPVLPEVYWNSSRSSGAMSGNRTSAPAPAATSSSYPTSAPGRPSSPTVRYGCSTVPGAGHRPPRSAEAKSQRTPQSANW